MMDDSQLDDSLLEWLSLATLCGRPSIKEQHIAAIPKQVHKQALQSYLPVIR
jgi:hypothetical protein